MEKRIIPDTSKAGNTAADAMLDALIARSVSRLDSSPGLAPGFARRTATLAAARARREREREERRERLMARVVPVACVVAAVVALVIVMPELPGALAMSVATPLRSILSGMEVSPYALRLAGTVAVVGAMLAGLNAVLRRLSSHRTQGAAQHT